MRVRPWGVSLLLAGSLVMVGSGCADRQKPRAAEPTTSQIRSDSDRFFDTMKEEEREHGARGSSAR